MTARMSRACSMSSSLMHPAAPGSVQSYCCVRSVGCKFLIEQFSDSNGPSEGGGVAIRGAAAWAEAAIISRTASAAMGAQRRIQYLPVALKLRRVNFQGLWTGEVPNRTATPGTARVRVRPLLGGIRPQDGHHEQGGTRRMNKDSRNLRSAVPDWDGLREVERAHALRIARHVSR